MSKSGGRYRIQADSVPVLYILASELLKRLTIRLREISSTEGKSGPPKFSLVTFSGEFGVYGCFHILLYSCTAYRNESCLCFCFQINYQPIRITPSYLSISSAGSKFKNTFLS